MALARKAREPSLGPDSRRIHSRQVVPPCGPRISSALQSDFHDVDDDEDHDHDHLPWWRSAAFQEPRRPAEAAACCARAGALLNRNLPGSAERAGVQVRIL